MNVIVLKRNNKEVGRLLPDKKSLLIGRSPICDLVVRQSELHPLHFLVEWIGDGDFKPNEGLWSLVDISQAGKKDNYTGEATILSQNPIEMDGFELSIVKDELAETALGKGAVTRSLGFDKSKDDKSVVSSEEQVLELITVDLQNDVITQVNHFRSAELVKGLRLKSLPRLLFHVTSANSTNLIVTNQGETALLEHYLRLDPVDTLKQNGQKVEIVPGEFHVLKTKEHAYYVRWVPVVTSVTVPPGWLKDPILWTFLGALIFGIFLSVAVQQLPEQEQEVVPVQRVARVEVEAPLEEPKAGLAAPTEEAKASTVAEDPAPPKEEAKPAEKVANSSSQTEEPAKTPPKSNTEAPVVAAKKSVTGLKTKAPVQDVNKMGLLGRLKSKGGSSGQVRADQVVNQQNPVEVASGDTGTLTVAQAPLGKVGLQAKNGTGSSSSAGLEAASTTLQSGKVGDGSKAGDISAAKSKGSTMSGASSLGTGGSSSGSGEEGLSRGTGGTGLDTASMEVTGGLTKDDIRKALAENRRSIRNCYERALLVKKSLAGRLTLRWKIAPPGNVDAISIQSSTVASPSLDNCVLDIVKKIQFAKAPNGLPTTVIYPFVFQGKN